MQKLIITVLVGIGVGMGSAQAAEVIVAVAPPAAIIETRPVAPHGHYVWVGGYQSWNGRAYAWVPGRWDMPPHGHSVWWVTAGLIGTAAMCLSKATGGKSTGNQISTMPL